MRKKLAYWLALTVLVASGTFVWANVYNSQGWLIVQCANADGSACGTGGSGFVSQILAGTGISVSPAGGTGAVTVTNTKSGTVTSVIAGTGLTGGTITGSGTIALGVPVPVVDGGTGQTAYTNGQLLIGDTGTGGLDKATLSAGTGVSVTNGAGSITLANTGVTSLVAGTGISVSSATGTVTVTNTATGIPSGGITGQVLNAVTASPAVWGSAVIGPDAAGGSGGNGADVIIQSGQADGAGTDGVIQLNAGCNDTCIGIVVGDVNGVFAGTIQGANAATSSNDNGKTLIVSGGNADGTGQGGNLNLFAGVSGATGPFGGNIRIQAANQFGTGDAGTVTINSGTSSNGAGGFTSITAGNSGGAANNGGVISVTAGNGSGTGDGGTLSLQGGQKGVSGTDGFVTVAAGNGSTFTFNTLTLTGLPLPTLSADAVNKAYVDNAIAGVNPAVAVTAATVAILPNSPTYNNGTSGVGAFITTATTNVSLVVDGVTPTLGQRILVKNEASGGGLGASRNGVYTLSTPASLGVAWILTRAVDYDQPSDINSTGAIPVVSGTVNTTTQWVITSSVVTVGTDALTYAEFSLNPNTLVVGPASATDTHCAQFNGTTGKLIADSGAACGTGSGSVTSVATGSGLTGGTITTTGTLNLANVSATSHQFFDSVVTNQLHKSQPACGDLSDAGTGCTSTPGTIASQNSNNVTITGGSITNSVVGATTLATGTSVSLAAPREYYVCTGTCTVTPPVPAAGDEFCILNDDNVATVITLAALGSSARYEATARTSYGTAGTGTMVSGGAVGDKVCIVGRDSTHYLTTTFTGTWTVN